MMLRNLQRLAQRKVQLSANPQPCQQWFPSFPLHCCVSGCFLWGLQKHTLQEVKPHVTQMRSPPPPFSWLGWLEGSEQWIREQGPGHKHRDVPSPRYQKFWERKKEKGTWESSDNCACPCSAVLQGVRLQSVSPVTLKADSTASHVQEVFEVFGNQEAQMLVQRF